jgi:hypothetical protein
MQDVSPVTAYLYQTTARTITEWFHFILLTQLVNAPRLPDPGDDGKPLRLQKQGNVIKELARWDKARKGQRVDISDRDYFN